MVTTNEKRNIDVKLNEYQVRKYPKATAETAAYFARCWCVQSHWPFGPRCFIGCRASEVVAEEDHNVVGNLCNCYDRSFLFLVAMPFAPSSFLLLVGNLYHKVPLSSFLSRQRFLVERLSRSQ